MKILNRIFCFAVTAAIVIFGVIYLGYLFRPTNVDPVFSNQEVFDSLPENSLDVIVYGSSLAWRNVDSMVMYDEYGIGVYNYAAFWQRFNTTELFVHNSLKTQTPKVALIEVSKVDEIITDSDLVGEIYYTKKIGNDERKIEYLNKCFSGSGKKKKAERFATYFVPFIQYHSNWSTITKDNFSNDILGENFTATMGYHNVDKFHGEKHKSVKLPKPDKVKQEELPEESVKILDQILEDFKATNTKIVFFVSPQKAKFVYSDAMKKYASENGCSFINLFEHVDEMGVDTKTDFYDSGHLNCEGAKKEARFLSDFLKENFELEDKRLTPDNLWEKAKKEAN